MQTREEWIEVVEKLKRDIENAQRTRDAIDVAEVCQAHLLKFAEKKLAEFPEPETQEQPSE